MELTKKTVVTKISKRTVISQMQYRISCLTMTNDLGTMIDIRWGRTAEDQGIVGLSF